MKRNSLRFIWTILLSIVFAGLTAQNVPVTLNSGWNWISYPRSQAMSLAAAMEGFTPAAGDVIKGMTRDHDGPFLICLLVISAISSFMGFIPSGRPLYIAPFLSQRTTSLRPMDMRSFMIAIPAAPAP